MYTEEELLMLSGVQHYAFCPRQWGLIHIEQQWQSNHLTLEGDYLHERADNPECVVLMRDVVTLRAVPLVSYQLGLRGISDIVELRRADGIENSIYNPKYADRFYPMPVEYKRGEPKNDLIDKVQVCAQAICLEEMYGIIIEQGALYYGQTRHREVVILDESLRNTTIELCGKMHDAARKQLTPSAKYSKRCYNCSMKELCMPNIDKGYKSVNNYLKILFDA